MPGTRRIDSLKVRKELASTLFRRNSNQTSAEMAAFGLLIGETDWD